MTGSDEHELRVAFVIGGLHRGGTETQAQLLVKELTRRRVAVDVYVLDGSCNPDDGIDFGDASIIELSPHRLGGIFGTVELVRTIWRLRRAFSRNHYDVIHAALARAYVAAPLAASLATQRPLVVAWRRNLGIHLVGKRLARTVERFASRRSDVVIANSESVKRYWADCGIVPAHRLRVVGNALEDWRFDRVPPALAADSSMRFVAVGGLRAVKGHEVLIDAVAELGRDVEGAEVVLVGAGPRRAELEARASRHAVTLLMPGEVADTRPWLGTATVYVHPSHSEGSSNAIAEAMAYGCAIIATDVGGARDMLGTAGVIVPPGDSAYLARELRALSTQPALRASLGAAARRRARDLFAVNHVVEQHLSIYRAGA